MKWSVYQKDIIINIHVFNNSAKIYMNNRIKEADDSTIIVGD
jgi:hypothetical protein